jgi:uncharacterized protein YegJ (DUF2314 family)
MSGNEPRRDGKKKVRSRSKAPNRKVDDSDRKLYGGLALVVAGLAALVWWSLPGDRPSSSPESHESNEANESQDTSAATTSSEGGARGRLERPPRASAEFAVITDRPGDVVRAIATASEIGKHLDVRHCGASCDAIKKFMSDADAFEIDIAKTEDLLLPPKDTLDTVAVGLTPTQRESVHGRPTAVVIRTQGDIALEQMPARAAFAAASVLAEQLDGFVYDEVSRRIETAAEFGSHTVTAKLGEPAFARKHIVIQLYRQDDGTARLLTLGMARFGSPDLSIRGANMSSGPLLAEVINAAAARIAHGKNDATIAVTLDDVARIVGKKPSDLNANPGAARPVLLDIAEPERTEGDPDNEMADLIPRVDGARGSSREAWDAVVTSLFGMAPSVTAPIDDKELAEVAKKAQRDLPAAIRRFEAGEGELFVKGPFAIPDESRVDGGAASEMLWIEAASCDARMCTGVLSNEPSYATNIALGKTTSVKRSETVDWMIHQRDGGTVGGESMKVLRSRAARAAH